jgi:small-conductance mechanosensitive channel
MAILASVGLLALALAVVAITVHRHRHAAVDALMNRPRRTHAQLDAAGVWRDNAGFRVATTRVEA